MGKLDGKIALVTGGTTGIGYETARVFRDEGATVIITGRNPANVQKAGSSLGVTALQCDQSSLDSMQNLINGIKEHFERIDILFVNAGTAGATGLVATISEAQYDEIMDVNLKGVYFMVQKAEPLLPDGSAIILTSSISAHIGMAGVAIYAASKAGVRSLGRSFAAEFVQRKIRVNTLTPGATNTPIFEKSALPLEKIKTMLLDSIPMGRLGEPAETAAAALFLASSDSSFMTGAEIVVSGGQTDL